MIIKLRMLMLLGLLISGFVFFSGCVQEKGLTSSIEISTVQPTTFTNKTPIAEITTYVEKTPIVQPTTFTNKTPIAEIPTYRTPTVQPTTFTNKTPIAEITTYVEKTSTVQPITSTEIYCVSKETGEKMSLSEARTIANNSDIGDQGTLKDTYSCNESTSTWWIDMNPTIVGLTRLNSNFDIGRHFALYIPY
jgi:hypothetical protein